MKEIQSGRKEVVSKKPGFGAREKYEEYFHYFMDEHPWEIE
ncbi:hypothetical protein [Bacillus sp. FJAT-27251]|nr:hypothetical protein [Bacillus sp. FJAT-27251]